MNSSWKDFPDIFACVLSFCKSDVHVITFFIFWIKVEVSAVERKFVNMISVLIETTLLKKTFIEKVKIIFHEIILYCLVHLKNVQKLTWGYSGSSYSNSDHSRYLNRFVLYQRFCHKQETALWRYRMHPMDHSSDI